MSATCLRQCHLEPSTGGLGLTCLQRVFDTNVNPLSLHNLSLCWLGCGAMRNADGYQISIHSSQFCGGCDGSYSAHSGHFPISVVSYCRCDYNIMRGMASPQRIHARISATIIIETFIEREVPHISVVKCACFWECRKSVNAVNFFKNFRIFCSSLLFLWVDRSTILCTSSFLL